MKTIPILFSYEQFKDIYPNVSSFYSFVNRNLKNENVKQIKKGLYALVDKSTGNIYANKFQIASALFSDSYFSYHEALEFYGLSNQSFVSSFVYMSKNRVNDLFFNDVTFKSKASISSTQIIDLMNEQGVRVVSLERAIIDSIDCISYGGGIDEVIAAIYNCPQLDEKLLLEMLEEYNKIILYKKVGYLFETYYQKNISPDFYRRCLNRVGNKVDYIENEINNCKFNLKWRLMVPEENNDEIF